MPIFGKAKKKKKRERIPDNLVVIDRFEYTFPALDPEIYIGYLERNFEERLTLMSEDGDPDDEGRIPHTRFVVRLGGAREIYYWYVGTIITTNENETVVAGSLGIERWVIVSYTLPLIPFILYGLIRFILAPGFPIRDLAVYLIFVGGFFLILYGIIYALIWLGKRETISVLGYVPHKVPQGGATGNLEGSVSRAKEKTSDALVKRKTQGHGERKD